MSALSAPTSAQAEHWVRDVGPLDALRAAEYIPTAGPSPRRLSCLAHIAAFLTPIDDIEPSMIRATINYVAPQSLAEWTREVIGDTELAGHMDRVIASGRAYGLLIQPLKDLVVERLSQCTEVLRPELAEAR